MTGREWHPPWWLGQFFRLAPWGFSRHIILILADGERTFPEIVEGFERFMVHMGHFGREEVVAGMTPEAFFAAVRESIDELEHKGVLLRRGEGYSLTPIGKASIT